MTVPVLLVVGAYLLGSVSAAILTCRAMGLPDPRTEGSGNPGATNVMRVGGKKAAAITLAGDMLKGLLPVLLAKVLGASPPVQALVGLAAFLGHLYPLFFGFQGGKGVATSLGALIALSGWLGLAIVATWTGMFAITRISSLSALTAYALAPLYSHLLVGDWRVTAVVATISILLFWRHRSNIRKLLEGSEDRVTDPDPE